MDRSTLTDPQTEKTSVLRYRRIDDTHLMIEGAFDGKQLRITLVKKASPLLATRGFHWVQEFPFNR